MREPRRFWREAGTRGFLALNMIIGGNILAALAFPVLLIELLYCLTTRDYGPLLAGSMASLHLAAIVSGLASTVMLGLLGLARQRRLRDGWILALTPLYWGCLSIATWRAVWQFWTNRYHWEKTEHGLARRPPHQACTEAVRATARKLSQR